MVHCIVEDLPDNETPSPQPTTIPYPTGWGSGLESLRSPILECSACRGRDVYELEGKALLTAGVENSEASLKKAVALNRLRWSILTILDRMGLVTEQQHLELARSI
jgi:hypothetical protein